MKLKEALRKTKGTIYKYIAVDADCKIYKYVTKPIIRGELWVSKPMTKEPFPVLIGTYRGSKYWKNTLRNKKQA